MKSLIIFFGICKYFTFFIKFFIILILLDSYFRQFCCILYLIDIFTHDCILGILYGNAYNPPRMEKELWRINRNLNLHSRHTHGPNVSLAFEFKNDIWTSVYVECTKRPGDAFVSFGGSQVEITSGKES